MLQKLSKIHWEFKTITRHKNQCRTLHYAPMNFSFYFIHQWGFHDLHPHQCKVVSLDWRRHQLLVTTVPTKKKTKRIRTTSAPAPTTNRRNLVLDPLTPVMSQKSRIWNFIFILFCIMNRVVDGIERSTKNNKGIYLYLYISTGS